MPPGYKYGRRHLLCLSFFLPEFSLVLLTLGTFNFLLIFFFCILIMFCVFFIYFIICILYFSVLDGNAHLLVTTLISIRAKSSHGRHV